MANCQGCGREGLKRSGINQHCHKSRDPRCKEYLTHLKHASVSRSLQVSKKRTAAPTTLDAPDSPTTAEALDLPVYDNHDLERTVQMTFVNDLVSSATEAPALMPEDHMMDIPCEAY